MRLSKIYDVKYIAIFSWLVLIFLSEYRFLQGSYTSFTTTGSALVGRLNIVHLANAVIYKSPNRWHSAFFKQGIVEGTFSHIFHLWNNGFNIN